MEKGKEEMSIFKEGILFAMTVSLCFSAFIFSLTYAFRTTKEDFVLQCIKTHTSTECAALAEKTFVEACK
jgi:hypothetical protein